MVFFVPYIVAPVVNAEIRRYILGPLHGVGPLLEEHLGWGWANVGFFTRGDLVLWSIADVDNWHSVGLPVSSST